MNKKEQLLMNAAKIIYEEGIQKLTMDFLAAQSDMTKGGVLYHFKNKSNLLYEMNVFAIHQFESKRKRYEQQLTGKATYTRSYALATLDFFKRRTDALLPAVFISSTEDTASFALWQETSEAWNKALQNDTGNFMENLQLKLICDGIWFDILHGTDEQRSKQMEAIVIQMCESLA